MHQISFFHTVPFEITSTILQNLSYSDLFSFHQSSSLHALLVNQFLHDQSSLLSPVDGVLEIKVDLKLVLDPTASSSSPHEIQNEVEGKGGVGGVSPSSSFDLSPLLFYTLQDPHPQDKLTAPKAILEHLRVSRVDLDIVDLFVVMVENVQGHASNAAVKAFQALSLILESCATGSGSEGADQCSWLKKLVITCAGLDHRKQQVVEEKSGVAYRSSSTPPGLEQSIVLGFLDTLSSLLGLLRGKAWDKGGCLSLQTLDVSDLIAKANFSLAQKGVVALGVCDSKLLKCMKRFEAMVVDSFPANAVVASRSSRSTGTTSSRHPRRAGVVLVPSVCECGSAFKSGDVCEGCGSSYCDIVVCEQCCLPWCGDCQMILECKICHAQICQYCRQQQGEFTLSCLRLFSRSDSFANNRYQEFNELLWRLFIKYLCMQKALESLLELVRQ